ncbi:MAG: class I SAM-dependent methyltransferase [Acidimicrobiia bacterium]|nr:class I SAM-dependent methyltransferase [Acidimicrobiia bacterium]
MAHDPGLYGRSFADVYDQWYRDVSDVAGTVARICELAKAGSVLELGSGTGRLAGPIADAGVSITALDASPEMNDRFAAKGHPCPIVEADMAVLPFAADSFDVVFIAFNTICNLTAPSAQRACIDRVAGVLHPGGHLVVEVLVPPEPDLTPRSATSLRSDDGEVVILTSTTQGDDADHVVGRHVEIHPGGRRRIRPWELRWISPGRLDELCDDAALTLVDRRADWRGTPFDGAADSHVSTYRRLRTALT